MYKVIESIKDKSWIRIQVVSFLRNQIKPSIYFVDPCLENPMDGGAWWAAVHGVLKSRTRLSDFTFIFLRCRGKWQPTPVLFPGESQG